MLESARSVYLDDFLATNATWTEKEIAAARERYSALGGESDVPAVLRTLSAEEWALVRSIIVEVLRKDGLLTDSVKIPLLYLAAESWDTVFWILEHAWCDELFMEDVVVHSYRAELEDTVLRILPCMLPPHRLRELTTAREYQREIPHDVASLFCAIQRIREEAEKRAEAIRAWAER